jgi:hypothetical protein
MKCPKCGYQLLGIERSCGACGSKTPANTLHHRTIEALSAQQPNVVGKRKAGFFLHIGILFVPYVFAWFTFRPGYSPLLRILSVLWCAFIVLVFFGRA